MSSSPDPTSQRDQIAELESQLKELQRALAEERRRRQEEQESAASRERKLQAQLREGSSETTKGKAPLIPRVASLHRKLTPPVSSGGMRLGGGERPLGATAPRTSDNLFPATGGDSRGGTPPTTPNGSRAKLNGTRRHSNSPKRPSPHRTSPQRNAEQRTSPTPETALQHAWNKFCVQARGEFTPQELSLVSAETLDSLLSHYGFTNAVEKAQVEAQWALLQEGKNAAANYTVRRVSKSERGSLRFPDHPKDFVVDVSAGGPHLSRRTPLRQESSRSANPNESTSGSGHVRTTSATRVLTPRRAAPANPNETQSSTSPWRSCVGPTDGPVERAADVHGMKHVSGPSSGEYTPRGIRSDGCTKMGGDAVRTEGKKHVKEQHEVDSGRRGIRTFDREQQGSPTLVQRPSKIVSTPPHIERSHLATETLVNSVNRSVGSSEGVDQRQRRTPFALDPTPAQSVNARARR